MNNGGSELLRLEGIGKAYIHNSTRTEVLRDITFSINKGELLAVVGPSGAGKSTLLNIIGTVDHPTSGRVLYGGSDLFSRGQRALADFRNRKLGFIFQFHHLLPEFTALENTMMPARIAGFDLKEAEKRPGSFWSAWGSGPAWTISPASFPGASSSGWRLPGPWS